MSKNTLISIEVNRRGGVTRLAFEVAKEVEDFYRKNSRGEKKSKSWDELSFYEIPDLRTDKTYNERLDRYNLFDDFGDGFHRDGKMNVAWLRTVGGKGELVIGKPVSVAELSDLVRSCVKFLREYMADVVRDFKLSGRVEVEVV